MISDVEWHVVREHIVGRIYAPDTEEYTRAPLPVTEPLLGWVGLP